MVEPETEVQEASTQESSAQEVLAQQASAAGSTASVKPVLPAQTTAPPPFQQAAFFTPARCPGIV
jgi:hypothetical protein